MKEVAPEARRRDAILSFAFVYPDKRGRFVVREVNTPCTFADFYHFSTILISFWHIGILTANSLLVLVVMDCSSPHTDN